MLYKRSISCNTSTTRNHFYFKHFKNSLPIESNLILNVIAIVITDMYIGLLYLKIHLSWLACVCFISILMDSNSAPPYFVLYFADIPLNVTIVQMYWIACRQCLFWWFNKCFVNDGLKYIFETIFETRPHP